MFEEGTRTLKLAFLLDFSASFLRFFSLMIHSFSVRSLLLYSFHLRSRSSSSTASDCRASISHSSINQLIT